MNARFDGDVDALDRTSAWDGVRAVVVGLGPAGLAAADNLNHLGARVIALDEFAADPASAERRDLLADLGVEQRTGPGSLATLPPADVLVIAAVPAPEDLVEQAEAAGVAIWSEVELAWRLRDPGLPARWLPITGTTGLASTAQLLEQMLLAADLRAVVCGPDATALVEAVMDPEGFDVLVVVLRDADLRFTHSLAADSAAVLDVGDAGPGTRHLGRVYEGVSVACVYDASAAQAEALVRDADVVEGARAIGFTLGTPGLSMVGLVEDVLADRAFVEDRRNSAAELGTLADLGSEDPAVVRSALAAAALARSIGVGPAAVREGLRAGAPETS